MPILVKCDFCGKKYRMSEDRAGMVLPCKDCGAELEVPSPRGQRRSAGRRPAQRGPAPRRSHSSRGRRHSSNNSGIWIACGIGGGLLLIGMIVGVVLLVPGNDDPEPAEDNQEQLAEADNKPTIVVKPRPPRPAPGNVPQNAAGSGNSNPDFEPLHRIIPKTPSGNSKPKPSGFSGLIPSQDNALPSVGAPTIWRVQVDPPQDPLTTDQSRTVKLKIPGSMSTGHVLFPAVPSRFVALGTNLTDRETREIWSIDPKRKVGEVRGTKIHGNLSALSADGNYFAVLPSFAKALVLFDVKKVKQLGQLPMGDRGTFLRFLQFAGSDRLLAIGNKNPLMVWKIPSGEPDREITLPDWYDVKTFTFSPGGKYLAMVDKNKKLLVFDLTTGKTAGELDLPTYSELGALRTAGLAFSQDGKELAGIFDIGSNAKLLCWNVTNGKLVEDITFAASLRTIVKSGLSYSGKPLEWFPGRQRWLLYGQAIADRKIRKVVWYIPGKDTRTPRRVLDDQRVIGASSDKSGRTLVSFTLPEEEIAKAAKVIQSGGTMADTNLPPLTKADRSTLTIIDLNDVGGPWDVGSDPAPTAPAGGILPKSIPLKSSNGRMTSLLLSRADSGRAAVMYSTGSASTSRLPLRSRGKRSSATKTKSKSKSAIPSWVDVYDLATREQVSTVKIPFASDLIAISPNGQRVLTRISNDQDRLDVWNVDDQSHVVAWRPFKDDSATQGKSRSSAFKSSKISAAVYVDNDHVLTMSDKKRITLWTLPACRAVYSIEKASQPGLSPNGKYLVISNGKSLRFFDALTGESRGDLQSVGTLGAAAFHPDGEQFAITFSDQLGHRLICWNLSEGQIAFEFPIPKTGKMMQWCGDKHLLLDSTHLIDVQSEMFVWKYQLSNGMHSPVSPDSRHWFISGKPGASAVYLAAAELPDAHASSQLSSAELKQAFLLKPGDKISLQVNLQNPPGKSNFQKEVESYLTGKFSGNGVTVTPGQEVIVQVTMTHSRTGKTREYKILGGFGRTGGGSSFSVSEEKVDCPITFMQGGKKIWERPGSFSNIGSFMVRIPEGKNAQDVATEGMWKSAANYLLGFTPPVYVFPEGAENGLGTSALIAN